MKFRLLAAALVLTAGVAQAQEGPTIAALTAQGKVLLASHYNDVTDQVTLIVGTVEGGAEYICLTRWRDGNNYDTCRAFQ